MGQKVKYISICDKASGSTFSWGPELISYSIGGDAIVTGCFKLFASSSFLLPHPPDIPAFLPYRAGGSLKQNN